jgi:hypothetical protein
MGNLLYLIAVILIIAWIFGYFITPMGGGLIHILLVIAILSDSDRIQQVISLQEK